MPTPPTSIVTVIDAIHARIAAEMPDFTKIPRNDLPAAVPRRMAAQGSTKNGYWIEASSSIADRRVYRNRTKTRMRDQVDLVFLVRVKPHEQLDAATDAAALEESVIVTLTDADWYRPIVMWVDYLGTRTRQVSSKAGGGPTAEWWLTRMRFQVERDQALGTAA